ncbi:hypothetical protein [Paraburkholderia sp. SIMBA_053]|uniref:hypothetical protein n=1 Tax=Paraburkholderia sp. SIMBA_053 TaxID=3085794 RepID=UPI00397B5315
MSEGVMEVEALGRLVVQPDVHQEVLAGYTGPYSLGVGKSAGGRQAVLILQVEKDAGRFPKHIERDGETVPVVVKTGYVEPQALAVAR